MRILQLLKQTKRQKENNEITCTYGSIYFDAILD